eukprot:12385155-Karenia_brevis.AAC.1
MRVECAVAANDAPVVFDERDQLQRSNLGLRSGREGIVCSDSGLNVHDQHQFGQLSMRERCAVVANSTAVVSDARDQLQRSDL